MELQSKSDIWTTPVIESSIWPVTRFLMTAQIRYADVNDKIEHSISGLLTRSFYKELGHK